MKVAEYEACLHILDKVVPALHKTHDRVDLSLDFEPTLHPGIIKIIELSTAFNTNFFESCLPTTGIPLARRTDYGEVLQALLNAGVSEMMLTLHGPEAVHNSAVCHQSALNLQQTALERIKACGLKTRLNLMMSTDLLARFNETLSFIGCFDYDKRQVTVPLYVPTPRLRAFEPHRAALDRILPVQAMLVELCDTDRNAFWERVEDFSEANLIRPLFEQPEDYQSFTQIVERLPQWKFVTIDSGLNLYYGNGKVVHRKIGNIRELSVEEIVTAINNLGPNYAISGYFSLQTLLSPLEVVQRYGNPRGTKVYTCLDDVLMRYLDELRND
jgi:hypothetical protein